jgi:hypothetical protein
MTAAAPHPNPSRTVRPASRFAAWAGVAFFVLFPVGVLFSSNDLDQNDSDAKWRDWFADSGNRTANIIGIYALVIASILFVVFASGLLERLRSGDGPSVAHRVAATTGTVFAGLSMVGAIQLGGISGNITFGNAPVPKDADIMRQTLGYGTVAVAGSLTAVAFIVAIALLARSTGLFPQWLVVVSYVAAVLLLGAVVFFPIAALPIWVLIVSIVLLRKGQPAG